LLNSRQNNLLLQMIVLEKTYEPDKLLAAKITFAI